jgi:hypothetical protein
VNYDPMGRARRGSSQFSRLSQTPLGCLKLLGTFILGLAIILTIILLAFGHVSHT